MPLYCFACPPWHRYVERRSSDTVEGAWSWKYRQHAGLLPDPIAAGCRARHQGRDLTDGRLSEPCQNPSSHPPWCNSDPAFAPTMSRTPRSAWFFFFFFARSSRSDFRAGKPIPFRSVRDVRDLPDVSLSSRIACGAFCHLPSRRSDARSSA